MSQQHTSLWQLELYVPWVPPLWLHWSLCFAGLTTMHGLVGVVGPSSSWFPGPALFSGCWSMVDRAQVTRKVAVEH